jgi:hypothetical protein
MYCIYVDITALFALLHSQNVSVLPKDGPLRAETCNSVNTVVLTYMVN